MLAVVVTVAGTGCASGGRSAQASLDSEPRPSTRSELDDPGGDPDDGPDDTVPEYGMPELTVPDLSVPDLSVPDLSIPGAEATEQCMDLTEAYVELVVLSYDSNAEAKAPALVDTLAAEAPRNVVPSLEYIRDAVVDASDDGALGATTLFLDADFNKANETVLDWLAGVCQPG